MVMGARTQQVETSNALPGPALPWHPWTATAIIRNM